jgi:hypothetical protein
MSKPTRRQKLVIEALKKQCDYWLTTNDIHSPSHSTDIDSELVLLELDDEINEAEQEILSDAIGNVWDKIASLDACTVRSSHGG